MPLEVCFQLSLFGKTSWERFYQATGWILEPSFPRSQAPRFQCLLLDAGQMPEWCEGESLTSHGGLWMPSIGQGPDWPGGSASSSWRILDGGVLPKYCLSPGQCSHFLKLSVRAGCPPPYGGKVSSVSVTEAVGAGGLSSSCGDRGPFLEAGRRIPITQPFQMFRMRGAAKDRYHVQFRDSFGFSTDPFPTLLAGTINPFAFYYEDDPAGGCIRFPTERESERLMGLPEGWTQYGAAGEEISPASRYKALGNAVALPCAEYIMAGIREMLS